MVGREGGRGQFGDWNGRWVWGLVAVYLARSSGGKRCGFRDEGLGGRGGFSDWNGRGLVSRKRGLGQNVLTARQYFFVALAVVDDGPLIVHCGEWVVAAAENCVNVDCCAPLAGTMNDVSTY